MIQSCAFQHGSHHHYLTIVSIYIKESLQFSSSVGLATMLVPTMGDYKIELLLLLQSVPMDNARHILDPCRTRMPILKSESLHLNLSCLSAQYNAE
jgi:hypothetical protein